MGRERRGAWGRATSALMLLVLAAMTTGLAYGVTEATGTISPGAPKARLAEVRTEPVTEPLTAPVVPPEVGRTATRLRVRALVASARPMQVRLLVKGDRGELVRNVQARLRQLAWYAGPITGRYDAQTVAGVKGFQDKRGLRVTGAVTRATFRSLTSMSVTPSLAERHNRLGSSASTDAALDPRCTTGRVICVDKTSQTLRWVVDGVVKGTMAVRFGAAYTPTREGLFHVQRKSENHVSTLFHTAMPFAMFFSGGQAVHYSSDFAARGYAGASHGCVNVRDFDGVRWLFGQVEVGDGVVVYRS